MENYNHIACLKTVKRLAKQRTVQATRFGVESIDYIGWFHNKTKINICNGLCAAPSRMLQHLSSLWASHTAT
eukprot:3560865-Amphidinium_carterae.1